MAERESSHDNLFRYYRDLVRALKDVIRRKKVADREQDFLLGARIRHEEKALRDKIQELRGQNRRESPLALLRLEWPFRNLDFPLHGLSRRVSTLEARVAELERLLPGTQSKES
jgi:hypothetical protein